MRFRLAVFVFLLMSIGCSGDTAATSDQEELELSDLSGVWANDTVVLRINDAGDFLVQPADAADEVAMSGFIARDDHRFIFVTGVGGECPGTRGAYTAAVDPDALALTLDDDPCDLRAGWFGDPFSAVTE